MNPLVENLFRREHGRVVAALARTLGPEHLELAEESIMEATLRALRLWPFQGIPDCPEAWLFRVARNHAIDQLKRHSRYRGLLATLEPTVDPGTAAPVDSVLDGPHHALEESLSSRLRLVFACCHPRLSRPSRVAITLKLLCGFSTQEIAHAFLATESTIAQRIVRARRAISTGKIPFEIPDELPEPASGSDRVDSVLDVLYLMFNEGYAAHTAGPSIRQEWVRESLDLSRLLVRHRAGNLPRAWALRALMLLQSSRLAARIDEGGAMVPLADQDRSLWDDDAISEGLLCLAHAGRGSELSEFHLLAGIAACHAVAPSHAETDWSRILEHYDHLHALSPSAVLGLNRVVAISMVHGAGPAMDHLARIQQSASRVERSRVAAVRAYLCRQLGDASGAFEAYEEAASTTENEAEVRHYRRSQALLAHPRGASRPRAEGDRSNARFDTRA